MQLLARVTVR
ncbi:Protein of unknown function [Bacillus mycoides]|nr:Protein of unknown function [Bacillus mycoides]